VGGYLPLIVLSDSTYPEFQRGDRMISHTQDPKLVGVGDLIAFFDPTNNGAKHNPQKSDFSQPVTQAFGRGDDPELMAVIVTTRMARDVTFGKQTKPTPVCSVLPGRRGETPMCPFSLARIGVIVQLEGNAWNGQNGVTRPCCGLFCCCF
jgi:hypothetical protein